MFNRRTGLGRRYRYRLVSLLSERLNTVIYVTWHIYSVASEMAEGGHIFKYKTSLHICACLKLCAGYSYAMTLALRSSTNFCLQRVSVQNETRSRWEVINETQKARIILFHLRQINTCGCNRRSFLTLQTAEFA